MMHVALTTDEIKELPTKEGLQQGAGLGQSGRAEAAAVESGKELVALGSACCAFSPDLSQPEDSLQESSRSLTVSER